MLGLLNCVAESTGLYRDESAQSANSDSDSESTPGADDRDVGTLTGLFEDMFNPGANEDKVTYGYRTCAKTGEQYEGPFLNGRRDGEGAMCIYVDGSKFIGSFRNDSPYKGTLITPGFTYEGQLRKNKFHRCGMLARSDGTCLWGEFSSNELNGAGREERPDGSLYTGNFFKGKWDGTGLIAYKDGGSFSGLFCDGLRDGEGTEILMPSAEKYVGQWKGGMRHGSGILTDREGVKREGQWRRGQPVEEGGWVIRFTNNNQYNGSVMHSKPHGRGVMKYINGSVYSGGFRSGLRHGRGLCVFQNGEVYDGIWQEDEPLDDPSYHCAEEKKDKGDNGDNGDNHFPSMMESISTEDLKGIKRTFTETKIAASLKYSSRKLSIKKYMECDEDEIFSEEFPFTALHTYPNGDTYSGMLDFDGLKSGHGVYTEHRSGSSYSGEFLHDKRHGYGVLITSLAKYAGQFLNDVRDGEGTLIFNDCSSYHGEFKNGVFHGRGVLCDGDGRVYRGDFEFGVRDGQCEEVCPGGTLYRGEYEEGKRNGVGTLWEKKGGDVLYTGQWKDDDFHGEGLLFSKYTWCDGEREKFEGMFICGQRSGFGVLTTRDGIQMKGKWLRDVSIDGKWIVNFKDGSIFSGHGVVSQDSFPVPDGFGSMKYENGDLYIGHFVKGKREGVGICVFENGDEWDGTWAKDAIDMNGKGMLTLADGTCHKFGYDAHGEPCI